MTALQSATLALARRMAKPRKCKACKGMFTRSRPMQAVCGPMCGLALAKSKREKDERTKANADRKEIRAKLDKIKSLAELADEAQSAVNKWVRLRDHDQPCISCGTRRPGTTYQAGHYLSRGAHPELRFHPDNIHAQCVHCNMHKAGNVAAYRLRLVQRIGLARVEWLESRHELPRLRADELRAIRAEYAAKARALEKAIKARENEVTNETEGALP